MNACTLPTLSTGCLHSFDAGFLVRIFELSIHVKVKKCKGIKHIQVASNKVPAATTSAISYRFQRGMISKKNAASRFS